MPFNVALGSTIQIALIFFSSGVVVTPSSATVVVTYPLSSNSLTLASCSLPMTQSGNFYIATWGSGVSAVGLASATGVAPGLASADPQTLRITG